ncbi:uncharacterized protein (UPF0261 family) [Anaerosolibacter carboniphilus]|uniref:Uncharacterized protein (UPF0261 family) n=1 Tax=Anaerosolibacter carboniphilus TaxID=1417629 RepID=A0A841KYB3_9FIRM|nr:Tm-1-like ATP-binding domain-containing protein [Anaerosolibacter carboniphilus]MBB6217298.1 uncharacterized protein (UPF0261 family) [Anaerosolibacter carboniphilus]
MKTIAILGTLDSKGAEFKFIKDTIEKAGVNTFVIHVGVWDAPFTPDVSNEEVAQAVGVSVEELQVKKDRGYAMEVMAKGAAEIVKKLYGQGKFSSIISLGGTGGTSIACGAMRALPIGVPKLMVSTVASGDTRAYVGVSDLTMMHSVVDISGINSISASILSNAAHAIVGMTVHETVKLENEKPLIGATMFGVTTPCVTKAREYLENEGYEVLVFHATGIGGQAMESLVEAGFIKGVLDITTTEWCDELVGGILAAGPRRLEAAGKCGVPQVVSTGALDMVNFGPYESVPEKFKHRNLYKHNPSITLMRTTVEECRELGRIIAGKLNMTNSPTTLVLPLKGVSLIDVEGQSFYGPEEDQALFDALRENIDREKVTVVALEKDINNEEVALFMAKELIALMGR